MRTKYVWFDLENTLFHTRREEIYKKAIKQFGYTISLSSIEVAYHVTDKLFMKEYAGVLQKKREDFILWYLGVLNYNLGIYIDLNKLYCAIKKIERMLNYNEISKWEIYDEVQEVLKILKDNSIGIGIISNCNASARKVLKENGIYKYFENIIISDEVGIKKPNIEIFKIGLKEAGVSANECVFVGDDYYSDIIGSKSAGMMGILVNHFQNYGIEELKYKYVVNNLSQIFRYVKVNKDKPIETSKLICIKMPVSGHYDAN